MKIGFFYALSYLVVSKKIGKENCGGAKTWALALDLSPAFYQQYVRGEEIMGSLVTNSRACKCLGMLVREDYPPRI